MLGTWGVMERWWGVIGWRNGDGSDADVDEMSPNGRVVSYTLERGRGVRPRRERGVDLDDGKASVGGTHLPSRRKILRRIQFVSTKTVSPLSAVGDVMSVMVESAGRIVVQRSF